VSGVTGSMWMKTSPDVFGRLRPICSIGFEEFLEALGQKENYGMPSHYFLSGTPKDLAKEIVNERAEETLEDLGDGWIRGRGYGKLNNWDITYKWDEPYSVDWMGMQFKNVESLNNDDCLVLVSHCDNWTMTSRHKFGKTFDVVTCSLLGKDITCKIIHERLPL